MKKMILTIVLSSIMPAIVIAEDRAMHNSDPEAPLMSKKHMMNANPNMQLMNKKHMMNSNPNVAGSKRSAKAKSQTGQNKRGWTVIKYQPK